MRPKTMNVFAASTIQILANASRAIIVNLNTSQLWEVIGWRFPVLHQLICVHLMHKLNFTDGWTRDRCLTTTKIPGLQKIPNAHETVCIIPTYVASVEEFYAYVPCACDCESKMDPKQLKELMNTPENRTKYEPVRKFPGTMESICSLATSARINCFLPSLAEIFELVFVKYLDDQFYRAKVTDLINDETHVCESELVVFNFGHIF